MKRSTPAIFLTAAILTILFSCTNGLETPLVRQFRRTFKNEISKNQTNLDAFRTSGVTAQKWSDTFNKTVYEGVKFAGEDEARLIANLGSSAILENFDTLPNDSFLNGYAVAMGELLQILKMINFSNVDQLAKDFAQGFEDSIRKNYDPNMPESKILTLIMGFQSMVKKQGLFDKEHFYVNGVIYANALYAKLQ